MKRIGNLYEKIISLDNLRLADEKARRGKLRSYGVLLHDKNREANILALHETLKNHTFKNSEYSTFTIYEPKERIIFPIAENRADKHGRGLDFVGFVFYHNQTLMRKSIKQNFCRMAARLNKKLNISARDYKQKLCSWYGWAKVSNSKHLLKTIIKSQFYDTFVLRCKAV